MDEIYFSGIVKNSRISCYLLIIWYLIINLLIAIYFVLSVFFSISSLKNWFNLIFISTLVIFYFSFILFIIEFFYLSDLVSHSFDFYLFYFEIIYEFFFQFHHSPTFSSVKFDPYSFNKLEKKNQSINKLFFSLFFMAWPDTKKCYPIYFS